MNIVELTPRIQKKELLLKRSSYQAKGYACLDALTLENWTHRWKWIEVTRKAADGSVSFWQFEFKTNKLEFSHFHRAVPATSDDITATRLWRGLEVVQQYPSGYNGPTEIDLETLDLPLDVISEARSLYLTQFERNLEVIVPGECA